MMSIVQKGLNRLNIGLFRWSWVMELDEASIQVFSDSFEQLTRNRNLVGRQLCLFWTM